jgi:hypothetical protein
MGMASDCGGGSFCTQPLPHVDAVLNLDLDNLANHHVVCVLTIDEGRA